MLEHDQYVAVKSQIVDLKLYYCFLLRIELYLFFFFFV